MAERRDTFLVMVQAPGLCMEGAGQGGKPQLSHDMIGMCHWRAIRAGGQVARAVASNGRSRRHYARTPCKSQKRNEFRLALILIDGGKLRWPTRSPPSNQLAHRGGQDRLVLADHRRGFGDEAPLDG